ncbi:MAG: hypothetical protein KDC92_07050 [Bacteroidetes bacterium]|nr:hypothetical protein [Bacteroidota bacterium]
MKNLKSLLALFAFAAPLFSNAQQVSYSIEENDLNKAHNFHISFSPIDVEASTADGFNAPFGYRWELYYRMGRLGSFRFINKPKFNIDASADDLLNPQTFGRMEAQGSFTLYNNASESPIRVNLKSNSNSVTYINVDAKRLQQIELSGSFQTFENRIEFGEDGSNTMLINGSVLGFGIQRNIIDRLKISSDYGRKKNYQQTRLAMEVLYAPTLSMASGQFTPDFSEPAADSYNKSRFGVRWIYEKSWAHHFGLNAGIEGGFYPNIVANGDESWRKFYMGFRMAVPFVSFRVPSPSNFE